MRAFGGMNRDIRLLDGKVNLFFKIKPLPTLIIAYKKWAI